MMLRALSPTILALSVACAAAPPGVEPDLTPSGPPPPALLDASATQASEAASPEPLPDAAVNVDASIDVLLAGDSRPALLAEGSECTQSADCESGLCEGGGCNDQSGLCVKSARTCSAKLAWYCGCDDQDFRAPADCPGRRFAYKARCTPARAWGPAAAPDDAPCLRASQCKSGVCEGQGCDEAHPGTCQPAMQGCGQSAVQYCGCDGRSFSSNPCPGVRFQSVGFCPVDPDAVSAIKVLSVSGKSAPLATELKSALSTSDRLKRCHLASGEKALTATVDFEVDGSGRLRVKNTRGLERPRSRLPDCIAMFARGTTLTARADATGAAGQVSVKLRFEITRRKP